MCIGKAEARQVGCDQVVAISQRWNQIAEHMRRRGEAVEQQDGRRSFGAGLTVKEFVFTDSSIAIDGHLEPPQPACVLPGKPQLIASVPRFVLLAPLPWSNSCFATRHGECEHNSPDPKCDPRFQ